ncbi:unknown protein [Seminavis robusta]|uniref:Uncharacterized protein n=1 Tax=Seminavis robusta TaxID=568900 RepID=A0A9N8DA70_9STRA|nr:unknown protein [Seminavis robusta]|eukprot:Sro31_g020030.1 n/a (294) ;mRNA; r:13940-14970
MSCDENLEPCGWWVEASGEVHAFSVDRSVRSIKFAIECKLTVDPVYQNQGTLTMTRRKGNLQSGDFVKERAKAGRHEVILRHDREDGKKHQWIVEFTNLDGSKSEEMKGSRALTAIDQVEANNSGVTNDEDNEPPVVATANDDEQPTSAPPTTPWRRPQRKAALNHAVCPPTVQREPSPTRSSSPSSSGPDFDWSNYQPPANDESSNDGFPQPPDELSEEEQSTQDDSNNNEQPMPHPNPNPNELEEDVALGEEDHIMETEEEFKLQEQLYRREKAELIAEGWTVEKETEKDL